MTRVNGVNLIGHAYAEIGLGEDLRMVARSLLGANIPFKVINIPLVNDLREGNLFLKPWETPLDQSPFKTSIFCLTPDKQEAFLLQNNDNFFQGQYLIGAWPWELYRWPTEMNHYLSTVDELWANSRHIEKAWTTCSHPAKPPIHWLPAAAEAPSQSPFNSEKAARKYFGIPEAKFVLICAFDLLSGYQRKNPLGAVKAFKQAFDTAGFNAQDDACLILKTHSLRSFLGPWENLKQEVANDPRIQIIETTYPADQSIELLRCCNGLLSLHRAEGFGRIIAESMILGLDIIATAYSGNSDYMQGENVYPISYRLGPVGRINSLLDSEMQIWAEPDLENAAFQIGASYQKYRGRGGMNSIRPWPSFCPMAQAKLSAREAGKRYKKRLNQIWSELRQQANQGPIAPARRADLSHGPHCLPPIA